LAGDVEELAPFVGVGCFIVGGRDFICFDAVRVGGAVNEL
jgi:hypothetical protein